MAEVRLVNVLIDINVLLDDFLSRESWVADAKATWAAHNRREVIGHVAAHGFTNLYYIARGLVGAEKVVEAVSLCLQTFEVVPVGLAELNHPATAAGSDFEDNLVVACAVSGQFDAIVTRDPKGFSNSTIPVFSPAELLARLLSGQ